VPGAFGLQLSPPTRAEMQNTRLVAELSPDVAHGVAIQPTPNGTAVTIQDQALSCVSDIARRINLMLIHSGIALSVRAPMCWWLMFS